MRCAPAVLAMFALVAPAQAEPRGDVVQLWIAGEPRGDVIIWVERTAAGERVAIPAELLCAARVCVAGGDVHDGVRYVVLDAIPGVSYRFDRDAGELRVAIERDALPTTTVALASRAPVGLEHAPAPSLFVNYGLTAGVQQVDARDAHRTLSGALEAGASARGALAYTAVSLLDERHVLRGLSSITVDDRARLVRGVIGDQVVSGGALGGGGVIGGLHLDRDFALDPYFVAQPTLTTSGVAATPSTVEIYRDGQLIRREILPPGPYRIADLIGTAGADTKVVVRDAFGLTRSVTSTTMVPLASALRPGLSTFDASLGFVRQLATSFDYGDPAALGAYRRGLTEALTVGARLEATPDRASGGASADLVIGHAVVEAAVAASAASRGGAAGMLSAAWYRARLTMAASVRAVSAHYATLDLLPEADRPQLALDATASWAVATRATVLIQGSAERLRDVGARGRGAATLSLELGGDRRLFIAGAAARTPGVTTVEASATFAMSIGRSTTATATGSVGDAAKIGAAVARALPAHDGLGYQLRASHGKVDEAFASVAAQGDHGRIEASAAWATGSREAQLAISGGIVAIGGAVAATRVVQGGFALVRVPDAPGVRVYLDNQPVGTTDARGNLIIPELQAFYGNRLRVDARDLPLDVATRALERVIAPPRRGGAVVAFSPARAATVRGRIVGYRGREVVDVSYGDLRIDDEPPVPIGHGGAFELEAVPAGVHRCTVQVEGLTCAFTLEVAADRGVIDVGAQTCRVVGAPGAARPLPGPAP